MIHFWIYLDRVDSKYTMSDTAQQQRSFKAWFVDLRFPLQILLIRVNWHSICLWYIILYSFNLWNSYRLRQTIWIKSIKTILQNSNKPSKYGGYREICTRSGTYIEYPIRYTNLAPNRALYVIVTALRRLRDSTQSGTPFMYPIRYTICAPDWVHNRSTQLSPQYSLFVFSALGHLLIV